MSDQPKHPVDIPVGKSINEAPISRRFVERVREEVEAKRAARAGSPGGAPEEPPTFFDPVERCRHCGLPYIDHLTPELEHRPCPAAASEPEALRTALEQLLAAATDTGRTNKPRASLNAAWVAQICEAALRDLGGTQ